MDKIMSVEKSSFPSVSNVVDRLNDKIYEKLGFLTDVIFTIEGIVRNVHDYRETSGWYYFNLTDEKSSIDCVVPPKLKYKVPADGDKVALIASVDLYKRPGKIIRPQLKVVSFTVSGQRKISRIHLEILRELKNERRPVRKAKFPKSIKKIAVITPTTSVAYDDIKAALGKITESVKITRIDFDGTNPLSLISQLHIADNEEFSIIIIARGGGEGLNIYNNHDVGKTIATMKTATITAIGHSTDTTLADLFASYSIETPTMAGKFIYELLVGTRPHKKLTIWMWILIPIAIIVVALILYFIFR